MYEPLMLKRHAARWTCVAQLSFHRTPRPAAWPATACVRPQVNVGEQEFLLPESAAYPKPRRTRKPLATAATADEAVKLGYRSGVIGNPEREDTRYQVDGWPMSALGPVATDYVLMADRCFRSEADIDGF